MNPVLVVPFGYTLLKDGDIVDVGMLAYTWINPECTERGWQKIEARGFEPFLFNKATTVLVCRPSST